MKGTSRCWLLALALLAVAPGAVHAADNVALDNPYVQVSRDAAPCADASVLVCQDRIVVAMGVIALVSGGTTRNLTRGQIAVFSAGQSYTPPPSGSYYEVAIKPDHPAVKSPAEIIPPDKNAMLYEGEHFFVYEERLAVGDTRARHSHSQRIEIRINQGPMLEQWRDGDTKPLEPSVVNFREAMIHITKNVGDMALFNIIVEFRPEPQ